MNIFMRHARTKNEARNPYSFILLVSVILTVFCFAVCIRLSYFASLSPAGFNAGDNISALYNDGVRYVNCKSGTLYYTGYDYTSRGKVQAHYYYSLIDDSCTIYLISNSFIKDSANPPLTLDSMSFTAALRKMIPTCIRCWNIWLLT